MLPQRSFAFYGPSVWNSFSSTLWDNVNVSVNVNQKDLAWLKQPKLL